MHRFYADDNGIQDGVARLCDEDARHAIRVLRLQPGDEVTLFANGAAYLARLRELSRDAALAEILSVLPSPEPSVRVTLYQGVPKGDKMDYIAQKCTEAGVFRVVPVNMPRCVARMDTGDSARLARWRRIAREAGKQAFRAVTPEISPCVDHAALPGLLHKHELAIIPWEGARGLSLGDVITPALRDIALVIGPEGGISPAEIALYTAANTRCVTLGPRIFRTETAGLAALVAVMALTGNMR